MKHARGDAEHTLAVFIDFENLALGFNSRRDRFRIEKVLERLVEKGKIVVKRAYCDWSRFGQYTGPLHEAAIELIEIPKRSATGKNSADIRLVVDAVDLAYSKDHIDTFVIVSGDSDFSPLVSKLKELGKHVIGLGLAAATSDLLRDNCDEFIYYEDLDRAPTVPVGDDLQIPEAKRKLFALLMDSLLALRRENKEVIGASMVKDTMKRKKPSFNEGYHGYSTFSELLEDAQKHGLLELDKHKSGGTYVVTRFGSEPRANSASVTDSAGAGPVKSDRGLEQDRSANRRRRGTGPRRAEEPQPQPRPVPLPPVPVPAPVPIEAPPNAREDDRALGRALIEDFEPVDDIDEVPSYAPRKKVAAKTQAPPSPTPRTPAQPQPPARRRPAEPGQAPARQRAADRPAKPRQEPKPAPVEDDSFGAGLDL